jgi:hypothetical protein
LPQTSFYSSSHLSTLDSGSGETYKTVKNECPGRRPLEAKGQKATSLLYAYLLFYQRLNIEVFQQTDFLFFEINNIFYFN